MRITSASVLDIERRDNPSKHYVFVILLHASDASRRLIFRRYNDFFEFQMKLIEAFPEAAGKSEDRSSKRSRTLPFIPGKILFGRSHVRDVAMERLPLLNDYLKALLEMGEEIVCSAPVEEFLCSTPEDVVSSSKDRASDRENSAEEILISEPTAMPRAQVVRDHVKNNSKEVTVKVGQTVEVLEKSSNGWCHVRADLQWGWMPTVCLEFDAGTVARVLQPSRETSGPFVVAKALSQPALALGSIVTVTEVRDDGWWRLLSCSERVPAVVLRPLRPELEKLLLRRKPRDVKGAAERTSARSLDPSPNRRSAVARSTTPTGRKAAQPPPPPNKPSAPQPLPNKPSAPQPPPPNKPSAPPPPPPNKPSAPPPPPPNKPSASQPPPNKPSAPPPPPPPNKPSAPPPPPPNKPSASQPLPNKPSAPPPPNKPSASLIPQKKAVTSSPIAPRTPNVRDKAKLLEISGR